MEWVRPWSLLSEAVVQMCSVKKVLLEISQNSQENTRGIVSFLLKLQALGLRPATLLKRETLAQVFPVNFAKFLRTPFFTEHLWWLLLYFTFINLQINLSAFQVYINLLTSLPP